MLYDGASHTSIASLADDVMFITMNGLSKNYRACGYRAGWMVISGEKRHAADYIDGLTILASMRLCANVPGQFAIQTALGGYQSINDLVVPGGRLARQRDLAWELVTSIPGVSCVKPKAALYLFPRLDPRFYPIVDDQHFILEMLEAQKVLVVQGTGFNWPHPDHLRLVFLPNTDDLAEAMGRFADVPGRLSPPACVGSDARGLGSSGSSSGDGKRIRRAGVSGAVVEEAGSVSAAARGPGAARTSLLRPIRVGLLGYGTVGSGVAEVLVANREEIRRRAGRDIEVARIAVRNVARVRAIVGDSVPVSSDPLEVVRDPGIDVVVELIGGTAAARDLVLEAIAHGKHVVTANKALLAVYGNEIFAAASRQNVIVAFEAAVAGGIPIIKALREGLTANRIDWLVGIINGTTNFILSEMRDKGLPFSQVLEQAQALGYAEADPTFDIEGIDAAHKLAILAAIAFGIPVQFESAYVEGISSLAGEDIRYAEKLGYRIKLLGIAQAAQHRNRAAGASHPDPHPSAARQCRRRHECGLGQGRRRRPHDVLRQGCR